MEMEQVNLNNKIPFSYYGGKWLLKDEIIKMMPPHKYYVELFGGGATVLLHKPPAEIEVYNDIDKNLYCFFKALRDNVDKLKEQLLLTPMSRYEREECRKKLYDDNIPELEKARMIFVAVNMSLDGTPFSGCFVSSASIGKKQVKSINSKIDMLEYFSKRIRNVILECSDFEKVVKLYNSSNTLFYADPPYISNLNNTKVVTQYHYIMSKEDHNRLINVAIESSKTSMWIISHYNCELYDKLLSHNFTKKVIKRRICANVVSIKSNKILEEALYISNNCVRNKQLTILA